MAATNTITPGDSVARFSSAGPGHNPTSPNPIPNSPAPSTSGVSISDLPGQKNCPASTGRERLLASMNPGTATASAAAITTARLGSHAPKISRKPSTLVGCTMPETSRPVPKISPQTSGAIIHIGSTSQHVMRDCHGEDRRHHEDDGGRDRAHGKPSNPANAVPG